MTEFSRLCRSSRWDPNSQDKKDARKDLKDAVTMEFNSIYGTDVSDLGSWQNLCQVLGITPIPDRLKGCRTVSCHGLFVS